MDQNKVIIIKPVRDWYLLDFRELWRFRDLFYILTWRDIKVRYKQTFLGIIWVIFQPSITAVIFTIFFGRLAKIPSGSLPYELFVFIGLVFWNLFSSALTMSSNSLIDNANLVKKVYFPREILPASSVITNYVDFSINFSILILFIIYKGYTPSLLFFITTIFGLLITTLTALGIGLFLASVNIKYRDIRYILPFFIQILLFLTPIIYPTSIIRDSLRLVISFNPMTSVVEMVRQALVNQPFSIEYLLISLVSSIILFFGGLIYFRKTERFVADTA